MAEKMNKENTKQTSLRLPKTLYDEIEILASKNERKPAEQIRYMLKEYIELKKKIN